jgi:hypothetical protein
MGCWTGETYKILIRRLREETERHRCAYEKSIKMNLKEVVVNMAENIKVH